MPNVKKKIYTFLKTKHPASGYVVTCIMIIVFFMFLLIGFQFLRLWVFASDVQKKVSSAVIQVSQDNYSNIYASAREGYTGAYTLASDSWDVDISAGDVFEELETSLGVAKENSSTFVKRTAGAEEYRISAMNVKATCSRFQSAGNPNEKFEATTTFTLTIPITFIGEIKTPVELHLTSKSNYSTKFM